MPTGREDVEQLSWCHDLVATDERQRDQLVQVLPVPGCRRNQDNNVAEDALTAL
jgi:hypothetical protein